ncbi:MAG: Dihydroorotate dehydrogenase B (NAD(+)), electron transfer subunit [Phycisphaerae bacterium]|nr:Dihydroorotate dehydrogenase B (NAD(+)), electron transfer subunit [Phycisphaerae bacterium]
MRASRGRAPLKLRTRNAKLKLSLKLNPLPGSSRKRLDASRGRGIIPAMSATTHPRGLFDAQVISNRQICREHFRLVLSVKDFPAAAPGQFVQLGCRDPHAPPDEPDEHEWIDADDPGLRTRSLVAPTPLLRRPFSLAGAEPDPQRPGCTLLEIIHRVVGLGTARLAGLREGDAIDLLGPLGNGFPLPRAGQRAVLVGGGVGIPPMIYLARALGAADVGGVAVCGVTTADLLPLTWADGVAADPQGLPTRCIREFADFGIDAVVASDDGSVGVPGRVTVALQRVLDHLALPAGDVVVYTCGPERMMRAVTEMSQARGLTTWVCMERSMACGMGTCQSCVCRVNDKSSDDGWRYRLVCTDGPVFDGRVLIWD